MNLLSYYGLDHAWSKFCGNKKLNKELSAFLPHLPGNVDLPGSEDNRLIYWLMMIEAYIFLN